MSADLHEANTARSEIRKGEHAHDTHDAIAPGKLSQCQIITAIILPPTRPRSMRATQWRQPRSLWTNRLSCISNLINQSKADLGADLSIETIAATHTVPAIMLGIIKEVPLSFVYFQAAA